MSAQHLLDLHDLPLNKEAYCQPDKYIWYVSVPYIKHSNCLQGRGALLRARFKCPCLRSYFATSLATIHVMRESRTSISAFWDFVNLK